MSTGFEGILGAVAASADMANQAIRASGVIVQVGRDAFRDIVRRQQGALVVHATSGVFRKTYEYLTSYKGLAFFACLSVPLDLPADAEIMVAKKIWVPG